MPNPTTTLALVAALPIGALLVAGIVAWARRGNAIVDEPRLSLVAADPTPDDPTALADVLDVDPPTTRLYVVPECPEQWQDEIGCDKPGPHGCVVKDVHAIHMCPCGSLIVDDLVQVGTAMVHRGCVADRRDGRTVRNCCAPLLARSATEVPW